MSVDFPSLKALVPVQRMDSCLRGNDRLEDQPMRCVAPLVQSRTVTIPVCYGGAYGPDMEIVCWQSGLSEQKVVQR